MKKKAEWSEAWQIAAVYVGTVIGAGFATGREIIEFFTRYGMAGTIGVAVSGVLFTWGGARLMVMARRIGAASYDELNRYLFGRMLSPFVTLVMTAMIAGVTAVMIAGAGAVFEEQIGWPRQAGVTLTLGLALLVMLFDRKGLFGVNVFVAPMMVLFSAIAFVKTIVAGDLCRPDMAAVDYSLKAMLSPFSYAAFNLAMAQAVLVPIAREATDERAVRRGAMLGGMVLTVLLLLNHMVLLSFPHKDDYDIPMAEVVHTFLLCCIGFMSSSFTEKFLHRSSAACLDLHAKCAFGRRLAGNGWACCSFCCLRRSARFIMGSCCHSSIRCLVI